MNSAIPIVRAIPGFCQPVSSLMHLCGALFALVAAVPLIRLGQTCPIRRRAVTVYSCTVVANLAISGVYHALTRGCPARDLWQRLDHFAIWLLIAGTFTAIHGVMCQGFWRRGVLTVVWSYAACGVMLQILWFRVFSSGPGLALYLGFGWLGVVSIVKLGRQIGYRTVRPMWYAGIAFTAGALLEAFGRHLVVVQDWVGSHEVFHVAVVAGVALHWRFIRHLLITYKPVTAAS